MKSIQQDLILSCFPLSFADGVRLMRNVFLVVSSKIAVTFILLMCSGFVFQVAAQIRPDALRSGPSSGSKSLSEFERIDPYSGNLNFSLPLTTVSGRGSATLPISLKINQKWMRKEWKGAENSGEYPYLLPIPTNESSEDFNANEYTYSPIYLPTAAYGRRLVMPPDCQFLLSNPQGTALTTVTFEGFDGKHYEFRDRASGGAPKSIGCSGTGFNRGKIFDSIDDSGAIFVADSDVIDTLDDNYPFEGRYTIAGKVITRDGTILSYGSTVSATDRNGNKSIIDYQQTGPTSPVNLTLTDPNGRQTHIEPMVSEVAPFGTCDKISFLGTGGTARYIRVSYKHLHDAIRPGLSLQTLRQMFPGWYADVWPYPVGGADITFDPLLPATVWLPNGQSYSIYYNSYAEVARVVLPTGGAVEYDWAFNSGNGSLDIFNPGFLRTLEPVRRLVERRVYSDGTTLDSKTTYSGLHALGNHTGNVTESLYDQGGSHLVNRTVHYYFGIIGTGDSFTYDYNTNPLGFEPWRNGKEYQTDILDSNGSTLLRRNTQEWFQTSPGWWQGDSINAPSNNPVVSERTNTLADTNQVSGQTFSYDSYGNLTDAYDYDYGSGAVGAFLRRTHTDYLGTNSINNFNYQSDSIHITGLPSQICISSDSAGSTKISLTNYEYDNYTFDSTHDYLTDRTNITGHDSTYSTSFVSRGNVTKTTSFTWAATGTGGVSTAAEYDITGNVIKTIDANGNPTTLDYSDRWGSANGEARGDSAPSSLAGLQTYASASSATNVFGWAMYVQRDFYTGALVDAEDVNGNISSAYYNDALDRPTQSITNVNRAGLQMQSTIAYDDANRAVTTTSDSKAYGDNLIKAESLMDHFGRPKEARQYEDATKFIAVQTQYDTLGRAYKTTSPFRPYLGETQQWTTSVFDSLGRVIAVTTPDSSVSSCIYSGSTSTVTDQAGHSRTRVTDGVGRLTKVTEYDGTTPIDSLYTYDVLGHLRKTSQTSGSTTQNRYFMYNDLGRLIRAKQVEQSVNTSLNLSDPVTGNASWSVGYVYDNNGNITSTTDALNRSIAGTYDELNRLTFRDYSDTTPDVTFTYEDPGIANSKGRLTRVSSAVSTTNYTAFDVLGHIKSSSQTTAGQTYSFPDYSYDLSGALISQTYPSGRVVTTDTDAVGRLVDIKSQRSGDVQKTLLSNLAYTSAGAVTQARLGNGKWESAEFNSRLEVKQLGLGASAGDTSLLKLEYEYGTTTNNGALVQQKITAGGSSQITQNYTYDTFNRLAIATETVSGTQSWKQTFKYDRFGNRRFEAANTTTFGSCSQAVCNPNVDLATNQLATSEGYTTDAEGNLTANAEAETFSYDAENRLMGTYNATTQIAAGYTYDGQGKRVRKSVGTQDTYLVYDAFGKLTAEYTVNQTPTQNGIQYMTADAIGSPRVVTDGIGAAVSRHDYTPFGEEIYAGTGGRTSAQGYGATDNARQKFTGYEQDDETGLDYAQARYYSSKQGRFTSVDPLPSSANTKSPQSFNRYAYANNSPYKFVDPLGTDARTRCGGAGAGTCLGGIDNDDATGGCPPQCKDGDQIVTADGVFTWHYPLTTQSGGPVVSATVDVTAGDSIIPNPITTDIFTGTISGRPQEPLPEAPSISAGHDDESAFDLFVNFLSGTGETDQAFGPSTAMTQGMQSSPEVSAVRGQYCSSPLACQAFGAFKPPVRQFGLLGWRLGLFGYFSSADGALRAISSGPRSFVGSFESTVTEIDGGTHVVLFELDNTTGRNSFLYHAASDVVGRGTMSNIHQTFWWREVNPCGCK